MKINKLLFTTTLTALALTACSPKEANSDSEIENKVEALLDKMTLVCVYYLLCVLRHALIQMILLMC